MTSYPDPLLAHVGIVAGKQSLFVIGDIILSLYLLLIF